MLRNTKSQKREKIKTDDAPIQCNISIDNM